MNKDPNQEFVDALRSSKTTNGNLLALARKSNLLFVRSLDQLAEDKTTARGRRLAAFEALQAYGKGVLQEVIGEGSALLCESAEAAGRVLRERRELLKLSPKQTAMRAEVEPRVVEEAEKSRRMPIRNYEFIAQALGLDERYISVSSWRIGNEKLSGRLRTIGDDHPRMTEPAISAIAEAAWVAVTQIRLEEEIGMSPPEFGIVPTPIYDDLDYPAYEQGYWLAGVAREKLKLGLGRLDSLRSLCEDKLGIPVIFAELGEAIAGVTVKAGPRRAIIINAGAKNGNVFVRRMTIAHELGHLLYDVDEELKDLRVDDFLDLDRPADQIPDRVEQRANAFAVEFIAPQKSVVEFAAKAEDDPVGAVMNEFGISATAARLHLQNADPTNTHIQSLIIQRPDPDRVFEAAEMFTHYYHPVRNIPTSRAGRFSAVVLRAAEENVISFDTAASYLHCAEDDIKPKDVSTYLHDLFPTVFS